MDYAAMLKKAHEELPEHTTGGERFTIPKVKGHIEGVRTIVINLKAIAKHLQRDPDHLLKYLLREMATPGKYVRDRVVFNRKVSAAAINKRIKKYASEFLFCADCGKPDTKLLDEKGATYLRCQACGAKKPVKTL